MEVLRKTVFAFYACIRNTNLLVKVDLASMCFVRNTDYIGSVGQKLNIFGKFLDSCQIYTTAFSALQFFTQLVTGFNADNSFVTNVLLGSDKLFGQLIVEISSIRNNQNSR